MQGKISIDVHLSGINEKRLKELTEKIFRVASTVFINLEKIKYEGMVEIIKVTLQYSSLVCMFSKKRPITVDFKVDFHPINYPSNWCNLGEAFSEKFQVIVHWELGSRTISFYSEVSQKNYLDGVSLRDEKDTTLASVIVQAMRVIIQRKTYFYSEIANRLLRADVQLSDLVGPLVGSKK